MNWIVFVLHIFSKVETCTVLNEIMNNSSLLILLICFFTYFIIMHEIYMHTHTHTHHISVPNILMNFKLDAQIDNWYTEKPVKDVYQGRCQEVVSTKKCYEEELFITFFFSDSVVNIVIVVMFYYKKLILIFLSNTDIKGFFNVKLGKMGGFVHQWV